MDTTLTHPPARRTRRRHSLEFRASVIRACHQPGVSVAAVALANGLNANMLRKWVADADRELSAGEGAASLEVPSMAPTAPSFLPLALGAATSSAANDPIRIEVRRGACTVSVSWPVAAADTCTAWLRELLR